VQSAATHGLPIITVKPNAVTPEPAPAAATMEKVSVTVSELARSTPIVGRQPRRKTGRPDLSEASIVVSGGRGTGGDFATVEEFADALGAAVGASRAAVDSGWYPHAFQVGRPARRSLRSSTSRPASPAPSSTGPACRPRRPSSRSTRTARRRSSRWSTSGVVGDLHTVLKAATAEVTQRKD
jgi:electron transfer flavoprotein alpha subunit